MAILITGVAGFIGSNLARRLREQGKEVVGVDNLSRGRLQNLEGIVGQVGFTFFEIDICDYQSYFGSIREFHLVNRIDEVWHLAANSDIPAGIEDLRLDLDNTFMTTINTLEVMKELDIKIISFASSSAIYGNHGDVKLHEEFGPLLPISNYGAMKLASEAAISAMLESALDRSFIFRFPNVIGIPATHGVILDFINKLKETPYNLDVLGDGTQQKAYLHVDELIDAMFFIRRFAAERMNCYNIGADDEGVTVRFIAEEVTKKFATSAKITYGDGNKGWVGDVPMFSYSIRKLMNLGWSPRLSSQEAVKKAVSQILDAGFS